MQRYVIFINRTIHNRINQKYLYFFIIIMFLSSCITLPPPIPEAYYYPNGDKYRWWKVDMTDNNVPSGAQLIKLLSSKNSKSVNELINKMGYPDYIGCDRKDKAPDTSKVYFLYVEKKKKVNISLLSDYIEYFPVDKDMIGFSTLPDELKKYIKSQDPSVMGLREAIRKERLVKKQEEVANNAKRIADIEEANAREILLKKITPRHMAAIMKMGIPETVLDSNIIIPKINLIITGDTTNNDMVKNESFGKLRNVLTLIMENSEIKVSSINYFNTVGFNIKFPNQPSIGYLFIRDNGDLFLKYIVTGDNGEAQTPNPVEANMAGDLIKSLMKKAVKKANP